jgi:nuclear polyadenylated RNA-binding protein 3
MPEPEAELQATADLSPVSPSPLHTAAPLVVPALQDTVDTIDAMVAAVAASNGTTEELPMPAEAPTVEEAEEVVDDESFSDAYGEDQGDAPAPAQAEQQQLPDINDDYAKTFDSPINHEEESDGGEDAQQEDVSSMPQKSNKVALSSNHLSSGPVDAPSDVIPEQSQTGPSEEDTTVNPANAQSNMTDPSPPADGQLDPATAAPANESAETAPVQALSPKVESQQPVADIAAQLSEPTSNPDASDTVAPPEASGRSSNLPSALPASSSLPPRPPQPQVNAQSNVAQHHPALATPTLVAQHATASAPGPVHNFVAPGAPGTSTEAFSSLPPPPTVGAHAAAVLNTMNVPSYSVSAPGYGADHSPGNTHESQWEQFMSDERQYMSEAKWDRFPEGSRIFIGKEPALGEDDILPTSFYQHSEILTWVYLGNLSSDKVSKREVFEIFHPFGRLAQISLKSAYGFVQYHTAEEGNRAMANLQGMEVKGRRIRKFAHRICQVADCADKDRPGGVSCTRQIEKRSWSKSRPWQRPRQSPRRQIRSAA